jgi:hypothetical protein
MHAASACRRRAVPLVAVISAGIATAEDVGERAQEPAQWAPTGIKKVYQ